MLRFVVGRVGQGLIVVLGAVVISFLLANVTGNPVEALAGATLSESARERLVVAHGYDRPFGERLVLYLFSAARGDFGTSFRSTEPAFSLVRHALPYTMTLVFGAVIVASALAVPVALLSLLRRESLLDLVLRRTLMVLQGLPEFFVGLVLVLVFAVSLAWLPSFGASGPAWYVLPIAALAIPLMSSLARLLRAQLLGILHEEFVTALRARGLGPREIVLRHGLRNALPPLIAYLALQLGWLVGGTVIVEVVFGIPGLGELAISATRDRDITVIQAVVVTVAVGYVGFNLLADLIVYTIDPRVRAAYA